MSAWSPYCVVRADILQAMPEAHRAALEGMFVENNAPLSAGSMEDLMKTLMLDDSGLPWVYWQDNALTLPLIQTIQAAGVALGYASTWVFWCEELPAVFRPFGSGQV